MARVDGEDAGILSAFAVPCFPDIHYFHCLRIVDLLKGTEASTKNIFGRYSSQRMKASVCEGVLGSEPLGSLGGSGGDAYMEHFQNVLSIPIAYARSSSFGDCSLAPHS